MTDNEVDLSSPDTEVHERWQLARRDDLATVFGIVLTIPFHGQDESGNWRYGVPPRGGMPDGDILTQFDAEMRSIIIDSAGPLVKAGILSEQQINAIESHPYETGPMAQSWPQFFFEIYQQAEPFISGGASFIAVADFLRQIASRLRDWQARKWQEIERTSGASLDRSISIDLDPRMVMTLPDLIALCYTDLIERYGKGGDIVIDTFPRSNFSTYATPGHPAGSETYLIRFKSGAFSFYYLIDGRGEVSEHYLMAGDDLTLLPLPDLLADGGVRAMNRQPHQSRRIEIQSIRSPR